MEKTALVEANSTAPNRPTMKTKKEMANISRKNWTPPGSPNFRNRPNIFRSNRQPDRTLNFRSFLGVKISTM